MYRTWGICSALDSCETAATELSDFESEDAYDHLIFYEQSQREKTTHSKLHFWSSTVSESVRLSSNPSQSVVQQPNSSQFILQQSNSSHSVLQNSSQSVLEAQSNLCCLRFAQSNTWGRWNHLHQIKKRLVTLNTL